MEFLAKYHPLVIHFPIALLFLYVLLEFLNLFLKEKNLKKYSIILLGIGVLGTVGAVLTGNQSYQLLIDKNLLSQLHIFMIDKHELYSTITVWYFLILLIVQFYFYIKRKNNETLHYIFIIFTLLGAILLYKTASFGGKLVYKYGIGTELLK